MRCPGQLFILGRIPGNSLEGCEKRRADTVKIDKVKAILDTGAELFARYGFKKTNIEDIARIARVAKATIYNHLGNKDHVYQEVLRREMQNVIDSISSEVSAENSPRDKLITFVKSKFKYMPKAINILNMYHDSEENILPGARRIRDELFNREVDILCGILEEGNRQGIFFLKYPDLTSAAMMQSLKGLELKWMEHQDEAQMERYLSEFISVFFYGVFDKNRPQQIEVTDTK
jgi:AcrR family transcriptional regulator